MTATIITEIQSDDFIRIRQRRAETGHHFYKELMGSLAQTMIYDTHRTVAWYADRLNVTPKHLSETVKRATGHSVMYFISQHTLSIVIDLLKNSPLSLSQLSEELGFSSLSYFTRYVRKHLVAVAA